MSDVVTGVTARLQEILPGQIGDNRRWTTAAVERYIEIADRAVRERLENLMYEQEIPLVADTSEYTLDSDFVDVVSVEYSTDGTNYDYYLSPATFDDLDCLSKSWRDDRGTRPEWYVLLGAPGNPNSKIHIHRPLSSVTAQTIRVRGHAIKTGNSGSGADNMPSWIQMRVYVPYVMSILKAHDDPKQAAMWWGRFIAGVEIVSRSTVGRYAGGQEYGW